METPWKVARRGRACVACGRTFEEGEAHFSVLQLAEGLTRSDRCVSCFRGSPAAPEEFFWRTRFFRDPRRRIAIDVEALREAFTSLPAVGDRAGLRYLVALLLVRKRVLRLVETRRGAGEEPDRLVLSPGRGSAERIEVAVPPLSTEAIGALRGELRSLLGLEEPETAAVSPPSGGEAGKGDPSGNSAENVGRTGGEPGSPSA